VGAVVPAENGSNGKGVVHRRWYSCSGEFFADYGSKKPLTMEREQILG
jgi:hypothetical protein